VGRGGWSAAPSAGEDQSPALGRRFRFTILSAADRPPRSTDLAPIARATLSRTFTVSVLSPPRTTFWSTGLAGAAPSADSVGGTTENDGMEWFIAAVVIVALGVAAVVAAGGGGEMAREPMRDYYRADLPLDRPLTAAEVGRVKFAVTLRGYSMAQVDDLLDRLAAEIAERDARLAALAANPTSDPAPEDQRP
jgi:DivIVA domain-containing protein